MTTADGPSNGRVNRLQAEPGVCHDVFGEFRLNHFRAPEAVFLDTVADLPLGQP